MNLLRFGGLLIVLVTMVILLRSNTVAENAHICPRGDFDGHYQQYTCRFDPNIGTERCKCLKAKLKDKEYMCKE